ncbi:MAG: MFS transporter [Solobacterium sp.]|nr:MFS transporter [Solobacterium sp.]
MKEEISGKTFFGYSFIVGMYWAYFASFVGFITTYLLACGLSSGTLSIVLAVFMLSSFIGSFFWGGRCDRAGSNRKIFIPEYMAAFAVAMLIFFLADKNVMLAACLYPVYGFLGSPLGSNLDAWMLKGFNRNAAVFGRARSLGSVGYAVMMLGLGQLINRVGYHLIPIAAVICFACVLAAAFIIPENAGRGVRTTATPGSPRDLLKIRPYVFLVALLFLCGLASSPINNLKIVILQSVGGDVSVLGIDAFIGVMLQAVLIFMTGRLYKIPAYVRLLLATVFELGMVTLTYLAVSPVMIILGTVLNNISYGILMPTYRQMTEASVSGSLKNTAHAMCDAMFGSFAGVVALLYSGSMMDAFGARSVALLGMGIMLVPVVMSAVALLRNRREA